MNTNYINIYNNLVQFSRNKSLFRVFTKNDTFSDRLVIFLFHFAFFLKVYKKPNNKKEMQKIYDYIFRQLELSIREVGYGDVTVNKKMKSYINTFHSILLTTDNWKNLNENKKDDFFKSFLNSDADTSDLTLYFDKYRIFLEKSSLNLFLKGVIKPQF